MDRLLPGTVLFLFCSPLLLAGEPPPPTLPPLVRTIDLKVGEAQEVVLAGGKKVALKLLDVREERDGAHLRQTRRLQ